MALGLSATMLAHILRWRHGALAFACLYLQASFCDAPWHWGGVPL